MAAKPVVYDDEDDSIEAIVHREQEKWRNEAKSAKFRGRNRAELFKEARTIERMNEKWTIRHKWDSVYYTLFLYIEICMKNNLHKTEKGDNKDDVKHVREVLEKIDKRVEIAKRGMLYQYRYHSQVEARELERKHQEEKARAAAAAAAKAGTIAAVGSMTLNEMSAAMEALRLPGQDASTIPVAILASKGPSASPQPPPDVPPPPYNQAGAHRGGMSSECSISPTAVTTMVLKPVMGDGSCAFRSIAQGMHKGTLSPEQEKRKADELRRLAVQLLIQRGGEEMVGTGMTIEQVVLMKDSYTSYKAYCSAMAKSEYAGETEFWLLSEELDIRIAIFMASDDESGGLEHMITYGTAKSKPVCLYWQRGSSELGNHYDCLLFEENA